MLEKTAPAKRVDPRVRRTRQWLQQALMDLVHEKGFEALTVQDIAERADVNRVTFYAHFPDKYALLEDTMRTMFQQKLLAVVPLDAPFSPENLARLIQLVAENLAEIQGNCRSPRGQMDTLLEKQVKAVLYEVLLGWLHQAAGRPERGQPTPEQAAMIASWAIYGAAVQWAQKEAHEPAEKFARQVLPLILAGLQPLANQPRAGRARPLT